jgi:hypothetical protein
MAYVRRCAPRKRVRRVVVSREWLSVNQNGVLFRFQPVLKCNGM